MTSYQNEHAEIEAWAAAEEAHRWLQQVIEEIER